MATLQKNPRYPNGWNGLAKNDGQSTVVAQLPQAQILGTKIPGGDSQILNDTTQQSATELSVSSSLTVHDDFKRPDQPLSTNPNWGVVGGLDGLIVDGELGTGVSAFALNTWKQPFGPNQFVQVTVKKVNTEITAIGFLTQANISTGVILAFFPLADAGSLNWVFQANDLVKIDTGVLARDGDVIRVEMYGALNRIIINGLLVATYTDTAPTPLPAIAILELGELTPERVGQIDDFWAGPLDASNTNFVDNSYNGEAAGYSLLGE